MQALLAGSGEELARNLREMCEDETQVDDVLAANGHLVLIGLLGARPDSKTTEHAVDALLTLSCHVPASRVPIVQAGAANPVVALCERGARVWSVPCVRGSRTDTGAGCAYVSAYVVRLWGWGRVRA